MCYTTTRCSTLYIYCTTYTFLMLRDYHNSSGLHPWKATYIKTRNHIHVGCRNNVNCTRRAYGRCCIVSLCGEFIILHNIRKGTLYVTARILRCIIYVSPFLGFRKYVNMPSMKTKQHNVSHPGICITRNSTRGFVYISRICCIRYIHVTCP